MPESVHIRRYLLGVASEEENAALECEYLTNEDLVARIAAAEDDLIEDYLSHHLTSTDCHRFESWYLAAPHHRVRVETVRRLMAHAAGPAQPGGGTGGVLRAVSLRCLALAASLLFLISATFWGRLPDSPGEDQSVENYVAPPAQATPGGGVEPTPEVPPSSAPPRVVAITLSPVSVRSASEDGPVVVPAGTDVVVLHLASDGDSLEFQPRRVAIRTVSGEEVWQGRIISPRARAGNAIGRVEVPAARLTADDYVVIVYGSTGDAGVEREWIQYFLAVRAK